MWSFRLQYHLRYVKHCYFVTLTYEYGLERTENGFLTLSPKHFRNFIKRIRKDLGDTKETPFNDRVKYVVTGEYGTKNARPHFHAVIFNVPYDTLTKHWDYGIIDIRDVSTDRIAYVFKYTQKARIRKQTHSRDDRVPEYVNFSQGLGKQWLTEKHIHYHKRNIENPTLTLKSGERIAIPRYYKNQIFTDEERQQIADNMMQMAENYETPNLTHDQEQELLKWKNEKIRIMNKKAKKDAN